jgi:hypothetical protein
VRAFLSPRWLLFHVAVVALIVAFLWLGWWQLGRAAGGNALSFGYAFEWPLFAIFVIFVWGREIRVARRAAEPVEAESEFSDAAAAELSGAPLLRNTVPAPHRVRRPPEPDPADPELGEYNRYLRWLGEHPDQRPGDYRRATQA